MKTDYHHAYLLAVTFSTLFSIGSSNSFPFTCAQLQLWGMSYYPCADGIQCVLGRYECDSIIDCTDGSDEDHCENEWEVNCIIDFAGKKTRDGNDLQRFQCDSGMCIVGCLQCDGKYDCLDQSDEDPRFCNVDFMMPPCN